MFHPYPNPSLTSPVFGRAQNHAGPSQKEPRTGKTGSGNDLLSRPIPVFPGKERPWHENLFPPTSSGSVPNFLVIPESFKCLVLGQGNFLLPISIRSTTCGERAENRATGAKKSGGFSSQHQGNIPWAGMEWIEWLNPCSLPPGMLLIPCSIHWDCLIPVPAPGMLPAPHSLHRKCLLPCSLL